MHRGNEYFQSTLKMDVEPFFYSSHWLLFGNQDLTFKKMESLILILSSVQLFEPKTADNDVERKVPKDSTSPA